MMCGPRRRSAQKSGLRRGFTIVELLVAMVLLSAGLLILSGLMAANLRHQRIALARAEMTSLADAKVEELRSYGMTASSQHKLAAGGSLSTDVSDFTGTAVTPTNRHYRLRWEVGSGVAGTTRATVRVELIGKAATEVQPLDFTTLISR